MDLERLSIEVGALEQALRDIAVTGSGKESRKPVEAGEHLPCNLSRRDLTGRTATIAGTRNAPSKFESFSLRNGEVAASGQENRFGPLSVV